MSIFIYDDTQSPVARVANANGREVPFLDIPDGSVRGDEGGAGTEEWEGESLIFTGGKDEALQWLLAALVEVAKLPDDVED